MFIVHGFYFPSYWKTMIVLLQSNEFNAIFVYKSFAIKCTAENLNPYKKVYLDRKHPIIITGKTHIFLAARLPRSAENTPSPLHHRSFRLNVLSRGFSAVSFNPNDMFNEGSQRVRRR